VVQLRTPFRLRRPAGSLESSTLCGRLDAPPKTLVTALRITETVHGRPLVIEVAAVAKDRWRAQLARQPGTPTALMPFYGATPGEAAHHLAAWLERAGTRRAG
jgi:hypothetical protein